MVQLSVHPGVRCYQQRAADTSAQDCALSERFMRQAVLNKTRPAIITLDRILSYGELARDARPLAAHLRRLGVGPETPVAVLLEPGIEQITAQVAIILAGGSVLPLDASMPDEQLAGLLRQWRVRFTLTDGLSQARVLPTHFVVLEHIAVGDGNDLDFIPARASPPQRTHLLVTGGACREIDARRITGRVINRRHVRVNHDDRVGCIAEPTGFAYQLEVWGALLNGAAAVVLPMSIVLDPVRLTTALAQFAISILFISAKAFNQVARRCPDAFRSLQYLLVAGDALDGADVSRVLKYGAPRHLLNAGPAYGNPAGPLYREIPAI
ncbi:AMP-binding protein [Acerihabitans arboris]|uniref:AMP-binding protein n=1 Tax=Acerihabitans arboris TaxID=2691583 RepID=A0A845SMB7_9GAMM|nr:AMP-binding protein [Acerihabitans arboris]NDL64094.1 AMP-binding protein [Acerihabitans arboris]